MVSTTVDEETGEERKRLINRMRWKGYGPASIMFTDANVRFMCFWRVVFSSSMPGPGQATSTSGRWTEYHRPETAPKTANSMLTPCFLLSRSDSRIALCRTPNLDPHVSFQSSGTRRKPRNLEVR